MFNMFRNNSRQRLLDMVDNDGLTLRFVSILDMEIVKRAVHQNGMALKFSETFNDNVEIGMIAVKQNGLALKFCSYDLKRRHNIVMEAVRQNGLALEFCSPDLKRNKDIVMEAVRQNGYALSFASTSLQAEKDIVLAAVHSKGPALEFCSPKLKADRDVIMAAMSNNPRTLESIPQNVMTKQLAIELVQMNGLFLSFLTTPGLSIQSDKDVVLAAVNQTGEALLYASDDLKEDKDVVLAAVNQTGKALRFASDDLQEDPLVLSYAKYSDQPIKLTAEQNKQVESFLKKSRDIYESFKNVSNTTQGYSKIRNLSNHGPHHRSNMLKKLYGFAGLDENILFILNKSKQVPDIGGNIRHSRKRKTRRLGCRG